MAKTNTSGHKPNRDRRDYDEFRESLATPVQGRTYRSVIDNEDDRVSVPEEIVRYLAVLLGLLIALRFVTSLFTADTANWLTGFLRPATDWVVMPFQTLFGRPPAGTGGFFDWPALAALFVVAVISTLLISLLRPREY
jgi:uncharacterized protein YggT (Ycf19 family)